MAPKVPANKNKKRKSVMEPGQGSSGIEPNWELEQTNRYLFRDVAGYENYMFSFRNRSLSDCYYFDKATVTFRPQEDAKIIQYITHLNWHPVLSCTETYTEILTRIWYSNLRFNKEPFIISTWVCGQEIDLSLGNVAQWLGVPNEGEETYLLRGWTQLADGTSDQYKNWFDRNNRGGGKLYISSLPSLHRLLFVFINNILIPKATLKTNLEWGPMYYLRHFIQMDRTFNISYIILRHMCSPLSSRVASLPYAHLIHKILRAIGIAIPDDQPVHSPKHLVNHLTRIGWILGDSESGLRRYEPDRREINDWIFAENALPNQYWNPEEVPQEQVNQEQAPPYNPENVVYPPMEQFVLPQGPQSQLEFLCSELYAQRLDSQVMKRELKQLRLRTNRNYREIGLLRESQASLTKRFIDQYGVGSTSESQPNPPTQQGGNEDEELNLDGLNDDEILDDDQDDEELQDDGMGNDDIPNE
jgi:hypothetical protein